MNTEIDHNKLIMQAYKLALDGKHITVPYLQKELDIEDEVIAGAVIKVLENQGKIIYVDLEGDRFWMDVYRLTANFGMPDNPEKDEKLIELIKSAKRRSTPVYTATVEIQKIKPFCEYKPKVDAFKKTKDHLKKSIEKNDPPLLHVYQDGDHLIMSDDYNAYYTYKEEGFNMVPCIIFGETDIEGVQNKTLIEYN